MSFMAQLAKFDSRLQRGLDNAFALVFGGRVVPAEIEELLKQQAMDNLTATDDDHLIAPNVYTVGVSSRDLENLSQDQGLPALFAEQMTRYTRNQGWELAGEPVVRIAEESGLRTGQLRVSSYISPDPELGSGFDAIETDPEPVAPPRRVAAASSLEPEEAEVTEIFNREGSTSSRNATITPVVTLLLQDGSSRTHHLQEGSTIIGRSNAADFRLPDTGVSREHAEITWDGRDAVLVDLESTNGTTVNQTPIDNWLLGDGDVITIGHSNIEVRIYTPDNV